MILYLITIVIADLLILFLNLFFNNQNISTPWIIIVSLIIPILLIAIDGIAAGLVRYCYPKKMFDYKVKFHIASKKECLFYEKIGIKYWKDHILELGMFTSFSKKNIASPNSPEYLERFIMECNYGVWGHLAGIVFSLLLFVFFNQKYHLTFILPAYIVNAVLSILPTMILRYNVPRLERRLDILNKKIALYEKRKEEN